MRVVTFQSVLNGVAMLMGLSPTRDLNALRAAAFTEYINQRMVEGWKFEYWPEWTVVELRKYRQNFSPGEFIEAGDERYFLADGKYYQALQGQASATQLPSILTNGNYIENSSWWALSQQTYTAGDWATGVDYNVGDQVRNPDDDQQYQCIAAHTAASSFDFTKFGKLTPFDKYIAYEQPNETRIDDVKGVYRRNPRVATNNPGALTGFTMLGAGGLVATAGAGWGALGFARSDNGIQVDWRAPSKVFIEFRKAPPVFTTEKWVQGTAYDLGDVVFYQGDCYRSLVANNTSVGIGLPEWELMPMPAILASWVKRAAYSDALRDQKQTDRATEELQEAMAELMDASDRELQGQGQVDTAAVVTYGR